MSNGNKNDLLESHKNIIFSKLYSKNLAWYYNRWKNEWDIVYKIKTTKNNENFWIVKDCDGKEYVANKRDLHDTPPTDKFTTIKVFNLIMNKLSQSIKNKTNETKIDNSGATNDNNNNNNNDIDDPFNAVCLVLYLLPALW